MRVSLSAFPMLSVPVIIYNAAAAVTSLGPGLFGTTAETMRRVVVSIGMISPRTRLELSLGDLILLAGFLGLFVELVSSTSSSDDALVGDAMTMILFVVCLAEFLLLPSFATATFFLLVVMVMMDSLAGFIVSAVSARKDIEMGG